MSGDFTFLKGNIETIILCSLYNEHKYGYEIAKEIKERTSNRYEIKQPTLYSYLKRLEEDDLIVSYWGENSNGGRRRYYALTKTGRTNCERFISEWQYQRTVLSELVDGTANGTEITQEEATPLFGRRTRRTKKKMYQTELEEQDEIARRLSELTGASAEATDTVPDEVMSEPEEQFLLQEEIVFEPVDTVEGDTVVSEQEMAVEPQELVTPEEPVVEQVVEEQIVEEQVAEQQTTAEQPVAEQQPTVIERIVYVDKPVYIDRTVTVTEQTAVEPAPQIVEQPQEDTRARFETNQDNPEDFIQAFDERARQISDSQQPAEGENYQHVLMGVIGDQLDGMEQINSDTTTTMYYEDHHAALEDVADNLAREGIRLRIYNHATAIYKPKTLIPFAKVLCQTSWLTYAIDFILFGILALVSVGIGKMWQSYIITLSVLLLVPIGFTIYAILDPTRKEKPIFNFRITIIVAGVICLIIILASVGLSALINGGMDASNFDAVSKQILIPMGIAILVPAAVTIYYTLYKRY